VSVFSQRLPSEWCRRGPLPFPSSAPPGRSDSSHLHPVAARRTSPPAAAVRRLPPATVCGASGAGAFPFGMHGLLRRTARAPRSGPCRPSCAWANRNRLMLLVFPTVNCALRCAHVLRGCEESILSSPLRALLSTPPRLRVKWVSSSADPSPSSTAPTQPRAPRGSGGF
jgi:hypothetical protein